MPHTPEPWDFVVAENANEPRAYVVSRDGGCTIAVLGERELDPDCPLDLDIADAERIVACVNACRGLNPETVPEMLQALVLTEKMLSGIWREVELHGEWEAGVGALVEELRTLLARTKVPSLGLEPRTDRS